MSSLPTEKKSGSEYFNWTVFFWIAIITVTLALSLFAGWLASGWSSKISAPQDKPPTVQAPPENKPVSKNAMVWKALAQRVQYTEIKTLQVVNSALEKFPHLAPLPRPNLSAAPDNVEKVETAPSPPIAWKSLSKQLAVTEQQEVIMLQHFLAQLDK